jgi:putative Ca2+/H+ antiporter (TMEM165/GDT1 family)
MPALAAASSHWATVGASAFGLIFLAEMGDKSQLVCMTLATRHRHWPVLVGAVAAFALLNTLAVVFGAGLAQWLPERLLAGLVALGFGVFGVLALRAAPQSLDTDAPHLDHRGVVVATFLMLLLAEMGDKTQLAVAGLALTHPPLPVWLGATAALAATSALGVLVGCTLLSRMPVHRLHQASGVLFLVLGGLALTRAI